MRKKKSFCLWSEDNDGNWETSCKEMFILTEGTPKENNMKYCPFCGKFLKEKITIEEIA